MALLMAQYGIHKETRAVSDEDERSPIEHDSPAYISDVIHAVEPIMTSLIALTKAVMELSVAGRKSGDPDFELASQKAFKSVGEALQGLNDLESELGLLKGMPPSAKGDSNE